jgi:capsular exopolysaccharide synthesis family protein
MMDIPRRPPKPLGHRAWPAVSRPAEEAVDLERVFAAARRQLWVVVVCAMLGLAAGVIYLVETVPLFTASSYLMIDPRQRTNIQAQDVAPSDLSVDSSAVDSQVEILKSERVFLAVTDKLNLHNNPEFSTDISSPLSKAIGAIRSILSFPFRSADVAANAADVEFQKQRQVVERLKKHLTVTRVGKTYVLEITYTSPSSTLSAAVANGFAEAYLTELLGAKYDAARRTSGWLQDRIADLKKQALEADMAVQQFRAKNELNTTQGMLRELEREAETYRKLYAAFLQRYQEAIQQQSFPITEARVIAGAVKPLKPSHPRKSLILALTLVLGGAAGVGIGALREGRERGFRTGEQVRDELGLEFLGELPLIESSPHSPGKGAQDGERSERSIELDPVMRHVLEAPLSAFSETLRCAKVAADIALGGEKPKIIGIVSVLPDEGKTTVAKNFASLLSHLGSRTLLIDGDIRNPGLTKAVAPRAQNGLVEALGKDRSWGDFVLLELESKLVVMPTVSRHSRQISHTSLLLSSPAMEELLTEAGRLFEYIVIDLPPLGPVVDVKAAEHLIDVFIFVVEWGQTARKLVRTTLENEPAIRDKTLGIVLNKVRSNRMHLYADFGSRSHYSSKYHKYYEST